MTNHTPGPWTVCEDGTGDTFISGSDDSFIAELFSGCDDESQARLIADAHLASAAPDMLEALRWIRHALPVLRDMLKCANLGKGATQASEMLAVIEAAIAKATGAV